MSLYRIIRPLLFALPAESAHHIVCSGSKLVQPLPKLFGRNSPIYPTELSIDCFGAKFPTPLGVAAGFDKNGELVDFLLGLGFGYVEVGSATSKSSKGNAKPRLFRLETDRALVNRMGLNNSGIVQILKSLKKHKAIDTPGNITQVGLNIAKTNNPSLVGDAALRDFVNCYELALTESRLGYIALNISCPNTEDGKTFEEKNSLRELLSACSQVKESAHSKVPVLLKFSPDTPLTELSELLEVGEQYCIDGYIFSNTSKSREGLRSPQPYLELVGKGGLSGGPLLSATIERVRFAYKLLNGQKPLIAVGGINSAEAAYSLVSAGASLLQLYTGLIYKGPNLPKEINLGLVEFLKRDGFKSISEAVGHKTEMA